MTTFLCVMVAMLDLTFAGKSKLQLLGSQASPGSSDRALSEDDDLMKKCVGKPALPSNADSVDCWRGLNIYSLIDDDGIYCEVHCTEGWRPARKNWTKCQFHHANSKRNFKWSNKIAACIPKCSDMSGTLEKLPKNVRVEQEINPNRRGLDFYHSYYELDWIKFSCDDQHQLSIKGRFKILEFIYETIIVLGFIVKILKSQ